MDKIRLEKDKNMFYFSFFEFIQKIFRKTLRQNVYESKRQRNTKSLRLNTKQSGAEVFRDIILLKARISST